MENEFSKSHPEQPPERKFPDLSGQKMTAKEWVTVLNDLLGREFINNIPGVSEDQIISAETVHEKFSNMGLSDIGAEELLRLGQSLEGQENENNEEE
jgi:hypothetical protein